MVSEMERNAGKIVFRSRVIGGRGHKVKHFRTSSKWRRRAKIGKPRALVTGEQQGPAARKVNINGRVHSTVAKNQHGGAGITVIPQEVAAKATRGEGMPRKLRRVLLRRSPAAYRAPSHYWQGGSNPNKALVGRNEGSCTVWATIEQDGCMKYSDVYQ
jgi:hypothetical protein